MLCCVSLWCRGYRVLAWRLRTTLGEVDIVARRGGAVALIEVKARQDAAAALCFDVMLVIPWHWPQHQPNAWGEGS